MLKIVGVMGSGTQAHAQRATRLGACLAREGVHLLTGGGGGVMAAVSEGFCSVQPRRGLCIAVLPAASVDRASPPQGYPNAFVELAIRTHLHLRGEHGGEALSRNHINVLSSDAIVLLGGGAGTLSEAELAVRYRRPVVAHLDGRDDLPGLPADIPIARELAALTEWLRAALAEAQHP